MKIREIRITLPSHSSHPKLVWIVPTEVPSDFNFNPKDEEGNFYCLDDEEESPGQTPFWMISRHLGGLRIKLVGDVLFLEIKDFGEPPRDPSKELEDQIGLLKLLGILPP